MYKLIFWHDNMQNRVDVNATNEARLSGTVDDADLRATEYLSMGGSVACYRTGPDNTYRHVFTRSR